VKDSRDPFALKSPRERTIEAEHRLAARVLDWSSIVTWRLSLGCRGSVAEAEKERKTNKSACYE
jgi:hypothetical protein